MAFPDGSLVSEVILSRTVCSLSSKSNLIFFTPSPALNRICLSKDDGVFDDKVSAKHTNAGVQGVFLAALLLPVLELLAEACVWFVLLCHRR